MLTVVVLPSTSATGSPFAKMCLIVVPREDRSESVAFSAKLEFFQPISNMLVIVGLF